MPFLSPSIAKFDYLLLIGYQESTDSRPEAI